jgi:hypothetical protein
MLPGSPRFLKANEFCDQQLAVRLQLEISSFDHVAERSDLGDGAAILLMTMPATVYWHKLAE